MASSANVSAAADERAAPLAAAAAGLEELAASEAAAKGAAAPGAPRKAPTSQRPKILRLMDEVHAATSEDVVFEAWWLCSFAGLKPKPMDDLSGRVAGLLANGKHDLVRRVVEERVLSGEQWDSLLQWAIGYTEGGSMAPCEESARILGTVFKAATSEGVAAVGSLCARLLADAGLGLVQPALAAAAEKPAAAGGAGTGSGVKAPGLKPIDYKKAEPYPGELDVSLVDVERLLADTPVDGAVMIQCLHTNYGFPRDARTVGLLQIIAKYDFFLNGMTEAELHAASAGFRAVGGGRALPLAHGGAGAAPGLLPIVAVAAEGEEPPAKRARKALALGAEEDDAIIEHMPEIVTGVVKTVVGDE